MAVKLRPGSHFAPTAQGVRCSRGEQAFLLAGAPALFTLVDTHLAALCQGTTVDDLVAAAGTEAARPVLTRLVDTLLDRDLLFDLDLAGGPAPDSATAERLRDVLSYVEEHCARPYAALARLRAARIAVPPGGGPALASLRRSLAQRALTGVPAGTPGPTVAVVVDDGTGDAAVDLPSGVPVLPLLVRPDRTVVGPVLPDHGPLPAVLRQGERIAGWQRGLHAEAVTGPVGEALAGSLAAQRILEHLTGTRPVGADLLVVHGRDARVTSVPFTPAGDGAPWRPVPAGTPTGTPTSIPGTEPQPEPQPVPADDEDWGTGVTTAFRGLGRLVDIPAGPGAPLHLAVVTPVGRPGPDTVGWGEHAPAARRGARLDVLRANARASGGDAPPGAVPAAGVTPEHFLLDGLLRLLGAGAGNGAGVGVATGVGTDEVAHLPGHLRVWLRTLRDYYDRPVRLRAGQAAGCWLAQVLDRTGDTVLASQWAPTAEAALGTALRAAVAAAQHGVKDLDPEPRHGTRAWETRPVAEVTAAVAALAALTGRGIDAVRYHGDPSLPGASGLVWWR